MVASISGSGCQRAASRCDRDRRTSHPVEVRLGDVGGIGEHIAARVMAAADSEEMLMCVGSVCPVAGGTDERR